MPSFDEMMMEVDILLEEDQQHQKDIDSYEEQKKELDAKIESIQDQRDHNRKYIDIINQMASHIRSTDKIISTALSKDKALEVVNNMKDTSAISDSARNMFIGRMELEDSEDLEDGLDDPHDNIDVGSGYRETG